MVPSGVSIWSERIEIALYCFIVEVHTGLKQDFIKDDETQSSTVYRRRKCIRQICHRLSPEVRRTWETDDRPLLRWPGRPQEMGQGHGRASPHADADPARRQKGKCQRFRAHH